MTNTYNVHIYREMKLRFDGIEAATLEAAAAVARDKATDEANSIDDCDGGTFAALVDVVGDEDFGQSRVIDFEPEQQRQAAAKLLAALETCAVLLADYDDDPGEEGEAYRDAITAIANATKTGIPSNEIPAKQPSLFEIEHDPLENPDRFHVMVDGRFDVEIIRTDEGIVVDVYPKDGFETVASTCAFDSDVDVEAESLTN